RGFLGISRASHTWACGILKIYPSIWWHIFDSNYARASLDRKSIIGGFQFLGCRLISWQCKKLTVVATSSTEAEYVAAASCCAQVLWIQNQLLDYGVTLWGKLGDVLVKNKTKHAGVCAMVLTGMSGKEYNDKLYLSNTSSTVFYDDYDIPFLQELRVDDSHAAPSKDPLPINCTQPRERMLENLLIWSCNRQNNACLFLPVMSENFRTKKGWNYPPCGYEKCRKGASQKNGKWVREACNRATDYPIFRYILKAVVADDTAHTVVVMFNDTATELLKCSAESLMGTEYEGSDADDDLNFPLAIRNLIGTTYVLEIKSHTYYEHGTFESFNYWKINPSETAEDDASSSTPAVTVNDAELHELEDSDVDEVCGSLPKKGKSSADVAIDTKRK
nr:nucleic acid-binding, OB-fold protein [Tanacetum cinerariifolium]